MSPGSAVTTVRSAGQVIVGGGLNALFIAVAELLSGLGSVVGELIVAVLLITAASGVEQSTWATMVIVAVSLTASEGKVTVRMAPAPPQVPPAPLTVQSTNVVERGRMSVTVTDVATSGPLLATLIV